MELRRPDSSGPGRYELTWRKGAGKKGVYAVPQLTPSGAFNPGLAEVIAAAYEMFSKMSASDISARAEAEDTDPAPASGDGIPV